MNLCLIVYSYIFFLSIFGIAYLIKAVCQLKSCLLFPKEMEFVDSVALVDIIDWRSLCHDQWLTGGAIDACVKYCYQNMLTVDEGMKQKFLYINASLSSTILSRPDDVTADCPLMKYNFKERMIFFPFNVDN